MGRRDDAGFVDFAATGSARMRRTAYLMCGDWDRAADIAQEALIRMYVAWPRLDTQAGLVSYARRTVVSVAIDAARKRSSGELPEASPAARVVEDPASGVAERMALMQALAQLPPRQRACVVLRYYEDLSVDDVAAVLGCGPGTVKSQSARGLATLRVAYRAMGAELVTDSDTDASTEASTW